MPKEFDLAGLGSVSGWLRLKHKRVNIPEGTPCANCATTLEGPFCHICGQFAEDMHRSIFKLCFELIESIFHVDGRVWRTLPKLIFRPGVLTRDYLNGKRMPQIPPFRLFLVSLLLLFFVGDWVRSRNAAAGADPLGFIKEIPGAQVRLPTKAIDFESLKDPVVREKFIEDAKSGKELPEEKFQLAPGIFTKLGDGPVQKWLKDRVEAIKADPERFLLILEIWAYRVAVLALPMIAILLTILFMFQRRFYVYDHLVYATHSLTFHLLLLTTILALTLWIGASAWWLSFASLVHVWFHMRKVYSTGWFGTLFRMTLLGFGTFIGFILLAVTWLLLGVNAMA